MRHLTMLVVLLCCTLITLPAFAAADKSVTVEFIWGIGGTTAHKGFVLRVGQDSGKTAGEVHVAHWFGARSNTAFGVGLTSRTEGEGQRSNHYLHGSVTIGLSYVFQTNSIFSSHLQPYFRVAVGSDINSGGDTEVEFSYSRYGLEVAEQFVGIGLRINDRYQEPKADTTSNKPDDENPDGDNDDDSDGDGNNGHGNDDDGCDESNPGNGGCNSGNDDDDHNNGHGNNDDHNNGHGNDDDDDDGNNGHGNDDDDCDESNPGNGGPPGCDDD